MKILLVEDRISRMEQFSDFKIQEEEIITVVTGENFDNLMLDISSKNLVNLDKYHCLIFHRSALNNTQRDLLKEYCKHSTKPLIFFSGGISSSFYNDKDFPFLHINSKDFYSHNFSMFKDNLKRDNSINLLVLQFGEMWKLNLLLGMRNDLNKRMQNNKIKRLRDLNLKKNIKEELISSFKLKWLGNSETDDINQEQIDDFKKKLDRLIIKSI